MNVFFQLILVFQLTFLLTFTPVNKTFASLQSHKCHPDHVLHQLFIHTDQPAKMVF